MTVSKRFTSHTIYRSVSTGQCFADSLDRGPLFGLEKFPTDPHILAHVNIGCPNGRHPKLKICISEMISDSYDHIAEASITVRYRIGP